MRSFTGRSPVCSCLLQCAARAQRGKHACGTMVCALLWVSLLASTGACAVTSHGEWSEEACHNGEDDDGDGHSDCDDPDCWTFSCASTALPMDAGMDAARPLRDAMTQPAPRRDAATPLTPTRGPDASALADEDASTSKPECTDKRPCPLGKLCIDTHCLPDPLAGKYALQVVSAVVPERNRGGVCYDTPCLLPGTCFQCEPDPRVAITLSSVNTVGTTDPKLDTLTPHWSEPAFMPVDLGSNSHLEFKVYDWDGLTDIAIFSCIPNLADLPSGLLRCEPNPSATAPPGNDGPYEIQVRATKVAEISR